MHNLPTRTKQACLSGVGFGEVGQLEYCGTTSTQPSYHSIHDRHKARVVQLDVRVCTNLARQLREDGVYVDDERLVDRLTGRASASQQRNAGASGDTRRYSPAAVIYDRVNLVHVVGMVT